LDQIKWQRGTFHKFFAQMKIRVGGSNAVEISKGDEFEYDGSILKYSGMELSQPQMRGAITNGWATLFDNRTQSIDSIRPNRNIAAAKTVNRDLNKVQRHTGSAIETSSLDEDEILRVTDRSAASSSNPKIITADDNRKGRMAVASSSQENEGAVTIGSIRTKTHNSYDVSRSDADKALRELENLSQVKADLYNKTVKEGITISSNMGKIDRVEIAQEDEGRQIGTVRTSHRNSVEGITILDTSNIRNSQQRSHEEFEVDTTPAQPAEFTFNPAIPARLRIARSIDFSFPENWTFEGKLVDRLAAVRQHGATPQFLEALYAAEGDQMRKVLIKEFPEQFGEH